MKYIYIIIFSFCIHVSLHAQVTKGIEVRRGSIVDFQLRNLSEIEEGKTLGTASGWTEILVYFDTVGSGVSTTGWNLLAYSNTTDLISDYGTGNMDLNEIYLTTQVDYTNETITPLSANTGNIIASGSIATDLSKKEWTVRIIYDCGKNIPPIGFFGLKSDLWYTDLTFMLQNQ